jgi:hypothetical protein
MVFLCKRCDRRHKGMHEAWSNLFLSRNDIERNRLEDDMRRIITVTVIIVVATITTAWTVSNPGITSKAAIGIGRGNAVPARAPLLW